jgi:hypothetical protein
VRHGPGTSFERSCRRRRPVSSTPGIARVRWEWAGIHRFALAFCRRPGFREESGIPRHDRRVDRITLGRNVRGGMDPGLEQHAIRPEEVLEVRHREEADPGPQRDPMRRGDDGHRIDLGEDLRSAPPRGPGVDEMELPEFEAACRLSTSDHRFPDHSRSSWRRSTTVRISCATPHGGPAAAPPRESPAREVGALPYPGDPPASGSGGPEGRLAPRRGRLYGSLGSPINGKRWVWTHVRDRPSDARPKAVHGPGEDRSHPS